MIVQYEVYAVRRRKSCWLNEHHYYRRQRLAHGRKRSVCSAYQSTRVASSLSILFGSSRICDPVSIQNPWFLELLLAVVSSQLVYGCLGMRSYVYLFVCLWFGTLDGVLLVLELYGMVKRELFEFRYILQPSCLFLLKLDWVVVFGIFRGDQFVITVRCRKIFLE